MAGSRDLNETLLQNIASTWRTDQSQFFESISVFPQGKEDRVIGYFPASHYPSEIDGARVELRIRLNRDVNLQYAEEWPGESWECRCDRHENPHNDYEHFHIPPDVQSDVAADVQYPNPPFGVIQVAYAFVEARVGDLWDGPLTYPSNYTFEWEYGLDIRS